MINTTDIECIAERLKIPKEDLEQFYIYAIRSVINEYMNDLDTSSLDAIIVTGRLLDSIKDYQHEHGMIEEATDNAFGSVFGKTIHDKQTGKQVVFLDAWEMLGLLDNNSIEQLYKDNEEQKKEAYEDIGTNIKSNRTFLLYFSHSLRDFCCIKIHGCNWGAFVENGCNWF